MKRWNALSKASVLLLGICVALVLCEIVLRVLGIHYRTLHMEAHPVLHHVHQPNLSFLYVSDTGAYGDHAVRYDAEGCVVDPDISREEAPADAEFRVAFLGDSFVEANQVAYRKSFVGFLEQRSIHRALVKNYGVLSYSPILYLLQWRERIHHFEPTHVFVLLYSNDIETDEEMVKSALYSEQGELLAVPGPSLRDGKVKSFFRNSHLLLLVRMFQLKLNWVVEHWNAESKLVVGGYIEENPDISPLSGSLTLKLADEVTKTGARFILMTVPSKYRFQERDGRNPYLPEFSDKWRDWAERNGVEFLDLVRPFHVTADSGKHLFFEKDVHLNSDGHAVIANVIETSFPEIFEAK